MTYAANTDVSADKSRAGRITTETATVTGVERHPTFSAPEDMIGRPAGLLIRGLDYDGIKARLAAGETLFVRRKR